MEFQDRVLRCAECNAEFIFTAGEQMFFADKGFKNEPKRCKSCKANRAAGHGNSNGNVVQRVKPTQGRPVYCRECFQHRRTVSEPRAVAM
jgi:hypothetical protein